ncbi:DnaB-like helicase N-terminal domain-containing protein [Streptomyces sp. NPDC058583]|uniref:DnaB-like helicase N-terminal domain-containing protein n=1 Tax=unclassified Streptomyces TaxID=2593676 RepID=UPI00365B372D
MPHAPDPSDEGLPYEPAEREPVHYAEQALLGALLLKPELLPHAAGLDNDAFSNPAHGALFTAMSTVRTPEHPSPQAGLDWLRAVLREARQEAPALTAAYLHLLISTCPRSEHAGAYAAMVRSEYARRSIRLHADTLAMAAQDVTVPDRPAHVLAAVDELARQLDALSRDFPAHPGSLPRTPTPPTPPCPQDDEAEDQERMLLASAVSGPAAVKNMRWLVGEDFTLPLHAGLWQCVSALGHRGDPVDPITVVWEAQHRGILAAGITPPDVIALLSTAALPPEHWGNQVIERALLARASHTASRITAYTDDPANTVHQLITGGRRALADLTAVRRRWQQATRTAASPPTKPDTFTASRAGPARSRVPTVSQAHSPTAPRLRAAGRTP